MILLNLKTLRIVSAIASGYIYGATVTIIVVALSTIVGSEIAFWLARRYGRPLIYRLASPATIERWDRLAGNRGGLFYFFTFVLPFLPSDLMCYVAGLGKVSHRQFFAANVAGRLLFTIAMTWIGTFKFHPPLGFWLLFFGVLAVLYLAWGIQNNWFKVLRSEATSRAAGTWLRINELFARIRRTAIYGSMEQLRLCEHRKERWLF